MSSRSKIREIPPTQVTEKAPLVPERSGEIRRISFSIPEDLLYFNGHFEGDPVLPGVAQLNDVVLESVERLWPDLGRLKQIRRLKFIRIIRPGEEISLELKRTGGGPRVHFRIDSGDEVCASGIMTFAIE